MEDGFLLWYKINIRALGHLSYCIKSFKANSTSTVNKTNSEGHLHNQASRKTSTYGFITNTNTTQVFFYRLLLSQHKYKY